MLVGDFSEYAFGGSSYRTIGNLTANMRQFEYSEYGSGGPGKALRQLRSFSLKLIDDNTLLIIQTGDLLKPRVCKGQRLN
jgi:hypothetical protein